MSLQTKNGISMGEKYHNLMKKGSKSGLLKMFGPNFGFYTKTSPQN